MGRSLSWDALNLANCLEAARNISVDAIYHTRS